MGEKNVVNTLVNLQVASRGEGKKGKDAASNTSLSILFLIDVNTAVSLLPALLPESSEKIKP